MRPSPPNGENGNRGQRAGSSIFLGAVGGELPADCGEVCMSHRRSTRRPTESSTWSWAGGLVLLTLPQSASIQLAERLAAAEAEEDGKAWTRLVGRSRPH